uniref:NADH-ubiquinone oxidoreductase chain 6 n=1 Tax=Arnoglossus tenuis TaxID=366891 RepID=A0A509Z7A5_9PLEU|nr:NADH dehydrogenase subunit 6 [Arnoglossus tenuis]AKA95100.1 NADH dehydrogenase subunit 6 [Arnoglossus tenuis]
MTYGIWLILFCFVAGIVAVASNPSPYFAALGLVGAAGVGCAVLVSSGGSFLSLVLFLIYLGGMLVVFVYSAALAADPYPEGWGTRSVFVNAVVFFLVAMALSVLVCGGWYEGSWVGVEEAAGLGMVRGDTAGVALMYHHGGGLLLIAAGVLLLALFVVLELTRGLSRGALRAV